MTPAEILSDLTARGITWRVDEAGNFRVTPAAAITPKLRALLVENKPALLKLNSEKETTSDIWHIIDGNDDIHVIYQQQASYSQVTKDYPNAELIEPFSQQDGRI